MEFASKAASTWLCALGIWAIVLVVKAEEQSLRQVIRSSVDASIVNLATTCPQGCLFIPSPSYLGTFYYDASSNKVCRLSHDIDKVCYGTEVQTFTEDTNPSAAANVAVPCTTGARWR